MLVYFVALGLVILDQLSKLLILQTFVFGESISLIPQVLYLTLIQNTGIAFGLFQNNPSLLTAIITACVILLLIYSIRLRSAPQLEQWAFGLILGGAFGNLIDRFRFGWVVDFIDLRVWPVFNLADSGITIGVILLAWKVLFRSKPSHEPIK